MIPDEIGREEFCEFLGWLTADLPELHQINPPKLLESWDRFQTRKQELKRESAVNGSAQS